MILPSGVSIIDRLLDGGVSTGKITHVFGEAGAGKTTFALQFVAAAIRLGMKVAYINTESTSPIERLEQITNRSFSSMNTMIRLLHPTNFKEQGVIIDDLELYVQEGTRLIVMDTITRLYRVILKGRKTNYRAHRELNMQVGILKGVAKQMDTAVIVLNQVRSSLEKQGEIEPAASNILDYWSDSVIRIKKGRGSGERVIERIRPSENSLQERVYLSQSGLTAEQPMEHTKGNS